VPNSAYTVGMACYRSKSVRQRATLELSIVGELDRHGAAALLREVEQFVEQQGKVIRLDLRGVSHLEKVAAKALLCSLRSLRARGVRMLLTRPSAPVRQVFALLGLDCFLLLVA